MTAVQAFEPAEPLGGTSNATWSGASAARRTSRSVTLAYASSDARAGVCDSRISSFRGGSCGAGAPRCAVCVTDESIRKGRAIGWGRGGRAWRTVPLNRSRLSGATGQDDGAPPVNPHPSQASPQPGPVPSDPVCATPRAQVDPEDAVDEHTERAREKNDVETEGDDREHPDDPSRRDAGAGVPPTGRRAPPAVADRIRWATAMLIFGHHLMAVEYFGGTAGDVWAFVFEAGKTGVTLFFILSGFVLAWGHKPRQSAGSFWWHRVARIYPLHLVGVGLALIAAATLVPRSAPTEPRRWRPTSYSSTPGCPTGGRPAIRRAGRSCARRSST